MILITEFMDEASVDVLRAHHPVRYEPDLADRQHELPGLVSKARALIVRNRTQVRAKLLDAAPELLCVGRLGVGLDNIDLEACGKRHVSVFPATGANNLSVAEYVITAAMVLMRGAWFANSAMLAGQWPRQECAGREIAGKILGLVGYGAIARDTARLARGLGITVCAHDPFVTGDDPALEGTRMLDLHELLAASDAVSLHVPLTGGTRHMIDANAIVGMKFGAVLINAARGGVVDEDALCAALREGRLAGAALDVFETEPLDTVSAQRFADVPNLILTPHIAGVTKESNARVSDLTARQVLGHLA